MLKSEERKGTSFGVWQKPSTGIQQSRHLLGGVPKRVERYREQEADRIMPSGRSDVSEHLKFMQTLGARRVLALESADDIIQVISLLAYLLALRVQWATVFLEIVIGR